MAMWSAHADSILSLQVINDLPSLITSGTIVLYVCGTNLGNHREAQQVHMNSDRLELQSRCRKVRRNKRDEANNIIKHINKVVSAEEQIRKMGF